MSLRRLVTVSLLCGITIVSTATPAFAHAELIASDPATGAALATPPRQVVLTFNEAVTLGENPVTVTGPGGAAWVVGTPSIAGAVVTAPVRPTGPEGAYTLTYRVVSGDGDDVTGSVAFTLTTSADSPTTTTEAAPTTTTTPAAAEESASDMDSGTPAWVWILGAAVVLAVGVVVALRLTRAKNS
ncbi:MAG: copper resistance CopC family protein [Actinophytocola sp.]|uniref:copper resistance CopC family protein n=1 Tax=Actinophytocola sp. TaxID=1872138 RepID=UPI003C712C8A